MRIKGKINIMLSLVLVTILTLSTTGKAFNNVTECDGEVSKVKSVTEDGYQERLTIFNNLTSPPGQLDPKPIVSTKIEVTRDGCLTAHFSTHARPTDNWIVFQVRISGNGYVNEPMEGHMIGVGGTLTPVIVSVEETNMNAVRIVSHTFFKKVSPGTYYIEVLMAGGNNVIPGDEPGVWNPTLVLYYN